MVCEDGQLWIEGPQSVDTPHFAESPAQFGGAVGPLWFGAIDGGNPCLSGDDPTAGRNFQAQNEEIYQQAHQETLSALEQLV